MSSSVLEQNSPFSRKSLSFIPLFVPISTRNMYFQKRLGIFSGRRKYVDLLFIQIFSKTYDLLFYKGHNMEMSKRSRIPGTSDLSVWNAWRLSRMFVSRTRTLWDDIVTENLLTKRVRICQIERNSFSWWTTWNVSCQPKYYSSELPSVFVRKKSLDSTTLSTSKSNVLRNP